SRPQLEIRQQAIQGQECGDNREPNQLFFTDDESMIEDVSSVPRQPNSHSRYHGCIEDVPEKQATFKKYRTREAVASGPLGSQDQARYNDQKDAKLVAFSPEKGKGDASELCRKK